MKVENRLPSILFPIVQTVPYECQEWEWRNGITYYPSTTVKAAMNSLGHSQKEYAAIFKKFSGASTAFQENDFHVKFSVEKKEDDTFRLVSVSITSDYHGADYTFSVDNGGVLVRYNHGS